MKLKVMKSVVNNLHEIQGTVALRNSNPDVFPRASMILMRPKVKSRVEFKENDNWKTA